ncbi:MAG: Glycine dehydrogenase [decarboxylating] (glycine cleavage system P1 protein) [Ktedonobacterales bacterium]|jgi:glycine dehydrogenase subunit 1|nr:MAG: Glycine dehydrogenase [decarboxylating] (glycine cleavage system P1 protein) [Ktedonobacterales bacterium]
MSYVPNTAAEQQEMLRAVGVETIEDLLKPISPEVRLQRALALPKALPEPDLRRLMLRMSEENADLDHYASFLGAGSYEHIIPSVVPHLYKRSEFYTSYTPYQPEISQGMLQAIYEFQTMICQITGMDVANASMYDGSTAVVEAALLAVGPAGVGDVLVSRALDPQYRATLRTYAWARGFTYREIGLEDGATSLADLEAALTPQTKAVIIQQPNFFGVLEDGRAIERLTHKTSALYVVAITEPASLGVITAPGEYGADIVAGEGQSLGSPLGYGGPALGFFASRDQFVRRLPGRLVGKTVDDRGQEGYVLTLQTREQHIRRERATSNICTNQALLALATTIYLAALGKAGFRELGVQCLRKAHYAHDRIARIAGYRPLFTHPYFDEFAIATPLPPEQLNAALRERGIIGGYDLSADYPELGDAMLFAVTEARTREDIDALVEALEEIAGTANVN